MIGLKIKGQWLNLILSGKKTMEVRSIQRKLVGQTIALGNSDNGLIEGFAFVSEIVPIPFKEIPKFQSEHLATSWLQSFYKKKKILYGYRLKNIELAINPEPYNKNPSIWFSLSWAMEYQIGHNPSSRF